MKKLNKFSMLALASALIGILTVPFVLGQSAGTEQEDRRAGRFERRWEKRGRHHGRHGLFFRGLNLTDAQKVQIKEIGRSYRERTQSLREELRAKQRELRQAESGGTFNEALATQKLTDMAPLNAKLMGERVRMRQEMIGVLTPEQKAQLQQKREEFKSKRAERRRHQNQ